MEKIRVIYYDEDRGNCTTIFKVVGEGKYFNRISGKFGSWYTAYPNGNYCESSSHVKDDILFEIVDKNGNLLFSEGNGTTEKPFRSIDETAKEQCKKWAEKLNLRTYEEWRNMLIAEKNVFQDGGYPENWMYCMDECKGKTVLDTFWHLGIKFTITQAEYIHKICGRQWTSYTVENAESKLCEGICGYKF